VLQYLAYKERMNLLIDLFVIEQYFKNIQNDFIEKQSVIKLDL